MRDLWNATLRRARLRHRNVYQTRHTFCSLALLSGEDPAWVARMMGHNSAKVLFDHYARFIESPTRRDGSAFSALLAGTQEDASLPDTGEIGASVDVPFNFVRGDATIERIGAEGGI